MDPKDLKKQSAEALAEARALVELATKEERDLTDDESTKIDELQTRADKLKADAVRLEKLKSQEIQSTEIEPRQVAQAQPGNDDRSIDVSEEIRTAPRYGRIKNFQGPNAERDAYYSGQWLRAVLPTKDPDDAGKLKARQWCKDNEVRILTGTTNPGGGATVPDALKNTIISLTEEFGVFRANSEIAPLDTDGLTQWPRDTGGVTFNFVDDLTALTESSPTFDNVGLTPKRGGVLTRIPNSLMRSSVINLADWVAKKAALAIATKEDACGFLGDGTSTFGGMVGTNIKLIDGNHAGSLVEAESGDDSFSELTITPFLSAIGTLPRFPGIRPAWHISQFGWAQSMQRLAMAAGGNTVFNFVDGVPQVTFLGFPVIINNTMQNNDDALDNEVMLLFGDLAMATTFGARDEISLATSDQRYFEFDQTGFKTQESFDINFHEAGDATNAGPLIGIIGTA